MAAASGRTLTLKKNGTVIAGLRTKSYAMASEPIDITTDDDSGVRKLLAGAAGTETLDISFEFVSKNSIFRSIALDPSADKLLTDVTMEFGDGSNGVLSGDVYLSALSETGEYQGAMTGNGALMSSGPWDYTES